MGNYLNERGCDFEVGEMLGGCNQCEECSFPPTSSPISFFSSNSCADDEKYFKLSLKTDDYGDETSWRITSPTNGNVVSGNGYLSNREYTETNCIPSDACTFEIFDSFGDGLCCDYGQGSYKVWVDNVEKGMGGAFESFNSVSLCATTPTTAPTLYLTPSPTLPPTTAPALMPTFNPTNQIIVSPTLPVTCLTVKINILTDNYPGETEWNIMDKDGNTVASGGDYAQGSTMYTHEQCLDVEGVYTFLISDNYGDGICCEHGSGSYNLSLGETTFIEGGEFSSSMQNKFVLVEQDTVVLTFQTRVCFSSS